MAASSEDSSSAARSNNRSTVFGRLLPFNTTGNGPNGAHHPLIPSSSSSTRRKSSGTSTALEALRGGLGCASSATASQAFAPAAAAVRASADWHVTTTGSSKRNSSAAARRKRSKQEQHPQQQHRRGGRRERGGVESTAAAAAAAAEVWCGPGIGLGGGSAAIDANVACVVQRGRKEMERAPPRERPFLTRRGVDHSIVSFMDSPTDSKMPLFGSDLLSSGPIRRSRGYHRPPGGLEEIMLFQTRMLLGGLNLYDQYRDLRLDVDNMTYEELLELEDKIGYVNTGLREDEIVQSLRNFRHSILDSSSLHFASEVDWKCSICQEECEANEEKGSLQCGHSYHISCIRQWLLRKNACPVCKTSAIKI